MEAAERLTTPQKLPTRRRKKREKKEKKRKEHMAITLHVQEVGLTIQITLMGIKMYMTCIMYMIKQNVYNSIGLSDSDKNNRKVCRDHVNLNFISILMHLLVAVRSKRESRPGHCPIARKV